MVVSLEASKNLFPLVKLWNAKGLAKIFANRAIFCLLRLTKLWTRIFKRITIYNKNILSAKPFVDALQKMLNQYIQKGDWNIYFS